MKSTSVEDSTTKTFCPSDFTYCKTPVSKHIYLKFPYTVFHQTDDISSECETFAT